MFEGYSDKTVDLFWGIRFNNSREWFAPRKEEFNAAVMQPTKDLANELFAWFSDRYGDLHLNLHVSRIYRDARRLFGRGPLKDHIWFSFQTATENRDSAPCFWFEIGADGYSYGIGWWMHAQDAARYRRHIDENEKEFAKIVKALSKNPELVPAGEEYAKSKGHSDDGLRHWYNKRWLHVCHESGYDALCYSPALFDAVKDAYSKLMPLFCFLQKVYEQTE